MKHKPKPNGCKGHYIPWVCGLCELKRECRPRELARYEKGASTRRSSSF